MLGGDGENLGGYYFFTDEVEPEDFRGLTFVKVAFYGVADLGAKFVEVSAFCEDGFAKSASGVSTFRGFFDKENQFVHRLSRRFRRWGKFTFPGPGINQYPLKWLEAGPLRRGRA